MLLKRAIILVTLFSYVPTTIFQEKQKQNNLTANCNKTTEKFHRLAIFYQNITLCSGQKYLFCGSEPI